jgi:hypothetical protein
VLVAHLAGHHDIARAQRRVEPAGDAGHHEGVRLQFGETRQPAAYPVGSHTASLDDGTRDAADQRRVLTPQRRNYDKSAHKRTSFPPCGRVVGAHAPVGAGERLFARALIAWWSP